MKPIFDLEGHDLFISMRVDFHRELEEIGDTEISKEAEYQLKLLQARLLEKSKRVYSDGFNELGAIKAIMRAGLKEYQIAGGEVLR
jgi:hypothetical protein